MFKDIKTYQRALWILVDEIEKRVGTEVFWGEGATETDVVIDVIKRAEQEVSNAKS